MKSNFCHLAVEHKVLFRLGAKAEQFFQDDPNITLYKLRQLGEFLIQVVALRFGVNKWPYESQFQFIRRLESYDYLEREIAGLFHQLRIAGNHAVHKNYDNHSVALSRLKIAWQLSLWFHRTFYDADFKSGPFRPPEQPKNENIDLINELNKLKAKQERFESTKKDLARELYKKNKNLVNL